MLIPAGLARWFVTLLSILAFQFGAVDQHAGQRSASSRLSTECVSTVDDSPLAAQPGLVKLAPAGSNLPKRGEAATASRASSIAPATASARPSTTERKTDRDGDGLADRIVSRRCRVTAYCDRGITAAGIPSGVGQCAAPEDIPLGSLVYIPELNRVLVVTDRTHTRFRKNTVDIFMPVEATCTRFGVHRLTCEFVITPSPARYGTLRVQEKLAAATR